MISISNLSKNYGPKVLFENISLSINRGEKIGLIGPNGAGKSTLFSIILGDTEPSSGTAQMNKGIRIGYLPQESRFHSERTVLGELTEGDETIQKLRKEKEKLEEAHQADLPRYGDILHELETLGYFDIEHKAKKILMGLGFKEKDFDRPITAMSGGWQMRTLLAKLLVFHYDILLLDEPTNYLDLNTAMWLKNYLSNFDGTFLMISHDKAYLNEVTNYTLILENGSIFKVEGSYEHFERIKAENYVHLERQFKEQEKKRKQLEEFIARFHAQPNKAQSVRAKRSELERLEKSKVVLPHDSGTSIRDFHFPRTQRSGYRVMALKQIAKSYGDINVYKDFDFEIVQNEKAVLVGENGAGKSTLLKILAGVIPIDGGERIVGHNVRPGYFSQTRLDVLNPSNTVLDEAYTAMSGYVSQEMIRTILGAFLFSGDDIDKHVSVLSGGEKSRLILAKLLIHPPNLLLLDEPTTHLDVDAVDALVKALKEYEGTVLFISHDIHFVRSVANVVFEVKEGSVRKFPGNFDYYFEKKERGEIDALISEHPPKAPLKEKPSKPNANAVLQNPIDDEKHKKTHNNAVRNQIEKLKSEREKLHLEHATKSRIVTTPRSYRDDQMLEEYIYRMHEIEQKIEEINNEIRALKKQIRQ